MKQKFHYLFMLLLLLVTGVGGVKADAVTFDATTDVTETVNGYYSDVRSYKALDGSVWKATGHSLKEGDNITIGKGGANYLETPEVNGTITSITVTWKGNTKYYLALQTIEGVELNFKNNPSSTEYKTETFTVDGNYKQLRLVGRRSSGTDNAAAIIQKVVVAYAPAIPYTITLGDDNTKLTEASAGAGVMLPERENVGVYYFAGWSEISLGSEETTTKPDYVNAGNYYPSKDVTLYPVYTRLEGSGEIEEVLAQTLKYDTWSYKGSTTDKSTYRLFHSGSYVESAQFDLGSLSKVVVYGGTFGGSDYNKLTIGDGENIWKVVTVSGSSQTGTNIYTDGAALSGNGKLRVTSNSGTASSNGVRISKIEIYVNQVEGVVYYIQTPNTDTPVQKVDIAVLNSITPTTLNVNDKGEFTLDAAFAEGTVANEDYEVSWESDNAEVLAVSGASYEAKKEGTANVTVKVTVLDDEKYNEVSKSFAVTVNDPNAPGTQNNPFTIKQAKAYINSASYNASDIVYVQGIISQIDSYNSTYKSITYWISDDGTDENQFECYSGRGLDNSGFDSVEDLEKGDEVVVCGTVKKYNSIYEFNYNNYIVSLKRKATPTLSFAEETYSVVKNGNMTITATTNSDGTISYESSDPDVAEIDASTGVVTAKAAGTTTITATVAATDTYKAATATVELTVTAPKHKATFYQNGEKLSEAEFTEDATIEFPEVTATIFGKQFVGWLPAEIEGTTNEASPVKTATMGTADVTYYAVYAYVEGEEKSSTLTNGDIKEYFTKEKPSYGTLKSYSDEINGVTWSASCTADAAGRPWIQIKKDADAYFKVNTEGNIANIKLTITSATNEKGGVTDITKHKAFDGTVYMEETASASPEGALGSSSDITDNSVTLVPTSPVKEVIIQVSAAARIWDAEVTYGSATYSDYCTTVVAPVKPAKPIIFHDAGEYEDALTVAIAGEGTIKYTLNGDAEQTYTYTAPFTINETTTIKAWAVQDGVESEKVTREYTIVEKAKGAVVEDGYYTIQNNDGKYVNVAGRKTVTLVNDTKSAGTVIRVKADEYGVKVLRSQAVDLPRYAERAMSYVPEIVKEVVKKLAANVDDPIIGEQGADLILDKFNKEFDYHLYLEGENNTYRIYGRTPSMKPVVDFYAENKELIDGRLLKVEGFVKEVLQKVVDKVGRGQSVVDLFKVKTIWQNMGGTLTEPTDDASTLKFYEEVLSSETNVWNFAYQTGMLYWEKVKGYLTENAGSLGDYGKYIEKIPQIRPNFKYYIVPSASGVDIISEGNSEIKNASTAWTLTKREGFDITFDANLSKNNGKEMYKTLYVDFGYKLPDGVTALKVTAIDENTGVAKTEEIGQEVAPQTPVLLKSDKAGDITLTIGDNFGSAVTDNLLKGNDYLINKYEINSSTAEGVFTILGTLSQSLADKYEYLRRKNAGTVGNKYFFALSNEDLDKCVAPNEEGEKDCVVRNLSIDDNGQLGFFNNWQSAANEAFLVSQTFNPVKLTLVGDINRDGSITIADVTALVNIILGKATPEKDSDKYDFDAAYVNDDNVITIADVTALVNIILGK